MIDVRKKSHIELGMMGIISEFPGQKNIDHPEGKITTILSKEEDNPNGVKVELINGSIGNLIAISDGGNSIEIIKKRLRDRENQQVERKSTFSFDTINNKKDDDLKTVLAIAVASFMNTDGGFVYVGVKDDGTSIGLDLDYSIMTSRPNNDGLEDAMKQYFNKVLTENIIQQQCIKYNFPIIDGKEICEIFIMPSKKPIFIKSKIGTIVFQGKQELICQSKKQRDFEDFYIRRGNSHYLVEKFSEFYDYCKLRFKV